MIKLFKSFSEVLRVESEVPDKEDLHFLVTSWQVWRDGVAVIQIYRQKKLRFQNLGKFNYNYIENSACVLSKTVLLQSVFLWSLRFPRHLHNPSSFVH